MASHLPLEIYENISTHLSFDDYNQLILVNPTFHNIFINHLFRHSTIHTKTQLASFLHQSRYHQHTRHLEITTDALRDHHLDILQETMPDLQSAHLTMSFCQTPSFHSFHSLVSLTLDPAPYTLQTLKGLTLPPRLEHLTIHFTSRFQLTIKALEYLDICPTLNTLTFKSDSLSNHWPNRSSTLRPSCVRQLSLCVSQGAVDLEIWLTYIRRKYSQLTTLKLKRHTLDWASENELDDDYLEQETGSLYDEFLSHANLAHVECENILPHRAFFTTLKDRPLRVLMKLDSIANYYFLQACELNLIHSRAITQLDLFCPPLGLDVLSQSCPNLSRLILRKEEMSRKDRIKLNVVLDRFPHLHSLGLVGLTLVSDEDYLQEGHPLEELDLSDSCVWVSFLDCISRRCLDLKRLSLSNIKFEDQFHKISLDLPQHTLETVRIQRPRMTHLDSLIRLFHLPNRWYRMNTYSYHPKTSIVLAQSIKPLDPIDGLTMAYPKH
ncbi:hypothetical protein BD560DRAFT_440524 [Blakeslea trispora]|nr:hypothetical protein BD560DRAFT_440524 [Blakeslea trispora]